MFPELEIARDCPAMTVVRKVIIKRKVVRIGFLSIVGSCYWMVTSPKFRPFPVEIV